ncbi:MAG: glycosyltransferase [Candidatus Magasanikbacteria bacterium]
MKLLILTQKVNQNDAILGFFHRWIIEFAKHCESVIVVCLEKGEYDLPENVTVLSLGKDSDATKFAYTKSFYTYIWKYRKEYDSVFVHMNPEYLVLGGLFWKLLGKKVALWYTHKSVDLKLRIAEKMVHTIFSASRKSFRLKSKKLKITGHGIDTDLFRPAKTKKANSDKKILLQVGRVAPCKNQEISIKLLFKLIKKDVDAVLWIVGVPVTEEEIEYEKAMKVLVSDLSLGHRVVWKGAMPNTDLPKVYNSADIILNFSTTGSMDKDVLEGMSCNRLVLTINEAYKEAVPSVYFSKQDGVLSDRVIAVLGGAEVVRSRDIIVSEHSLPSLIKGIIERYGV